MKTRRATQRSFPGRLTLDDWLTLPGFVRRDLIDRAACELLSCHRLCDGKECRRHRTCCGDDATACKARLWQRASGHPMTLRRELNRLRNLAGLGRMEGEIRKSAVEGFLRVAGLNAPWTAPAVLPGAIAGPPQTGPGPGFGPAEKSRGFGLQRGGEFL